jgi:pilus assembly protein CpaE
MSKITVLINGPTTELSDGIRAMLAEQADLDVTVKISDMPPDAVVGLATRPDVMVVALGTQWEEGLQSLGAMRPSQRPPTIAIGSFAGPHVMRRAMQAGVRDYLPAPVRAGDLLEAVRRIAREHGVAPVDPERGTLIAVMNVKGGSGASFVAANLAHIVAARRNIEVGLLDLDLQFGALPLSFDLEQRTTLLEALLASEHLDQVALKGYMARHDSGVYVLSAMAEQLALPWEIPPQALNNLIAVMRQTFPVVVADLPRQIDPLSTAVLDQADKVLMVTQQSLAHTRDAKRMQHVLLNTLSVPRERLMLILNRHTDKQSIRGRDIVETVNPPSMTVLPNDFRTVSEALDVGAPIYDHNRESPISKAMVELVDSLGIKAGTPVAKPRRGLRAALAGALGH